MFPSFGGNSFYALNVYLFLGTFTVFTRSDEIERNTVIVTFSDITIASWNNDGKTTKLKRIIAVVANGYCSSNYDKCGLCFWNTTRIFSDSDVKIVSNYPKQVENDVKILLYVVLPSGNDIRKNSTVLFNSVLDDIVEANSTQISAAVSAQLKSKSDDSTPKPELDNTLDYIMIPVGFGLLVFVIVLACCLHYCHKRKMEEIRKEERRQFVLQQKAGSSKPVSPFQTTVKQVPEVAVKPQPRQEQKLYYENEQEDNQKVIIEKEKYSPPKNEKHRDPKQRDNLYDNVDGSQLDMKRKENLEEKEPVSDVSDHERRHSKRKKKKRRRHKKRGDSLRNDDDQECESDDEAIHPPHVVDDDISSRLPPPRKLPPLKTNNSAFVEDDELQDENILNMH